MVVETVIEVTEIECCDVDDNTIYETPEVFNYLDNILSHRQSKNSFIGYNNSVDSRNNDEESFMSTNASQTCENDCESSILCNENYDAIDGIPQSVLIEPNDFEYYKDNYNIYCKENFYYDEGEQKQMKCLNRIVYIILFAIAIYTTVFIINLFELHENSEKR
ncbi:uncharacterized protein LOC105261925 [Musca domestica]|uniref:Uncharacterized protein LOC105261925 n=1 Tax=Musca domestica TaxID=7370 RepID=A0A1I8NK72_MUSDO|nr:uncharacterized protein LOC105261925 [Musca domestica]